MHRHAILTGPVNVFLLAALAVFALSHPGMLRAEMLRRGQVSAPFSPGEIIRLKIKWNVVHVADVALEVLPAEGFGGAPAHHFSLKAVSKPVVDILYKVRRRVDAFADLSVSRSLYYEKRDETDPERHIVVYFDWDRQTVQYTRVHKKRRPVPIPPGTFDPLSLFYGFRKHTLRVGQTLRAPVTDGKRYVMAEARVLRKEQVTVDSGTYDTFLVEPDLGRVILGIFKKRRGAKLRIWVSADGRRIPVKVESEVSIGRFTAELHTYEPAQESVNGGGCPGPPVERVRWVSYGE